MFCIALLFWPPPIGTIAQKKRGPISYKDIVSSHFLVKFLEKILVSHFQKFIPSTPQFSNLIYLRIHVVTKKKRLRDLRTENRVIQQVQSGGPHLHTEATYPHQTK